MDLVEWLRAQLDEDERVARSADIGPWEVGPNFGARDNRVYVRQEGDLIDSIGTCVIAGQVSNKLRFRGNAQHIARHDPARVLREVEAKRRILDEYDAALASRKRHPDDLACTGWLLATIRVMKLLALPYSDRPGYRPEWAPSDT